MGESSRGRANSEKTADAQAPVTRRVNVNFSENVYQMLEALAEKKGKTMSEILRDAIALEKWVQDETDAGGRLLVDRGGQVRELVVR